MPGKETEERIPDTHGVTPVSWKRDCNLKVRASLRPTEAPGMLYGAGSLQQWLGLLKSCPTGGLAGVQGCPSSALPLRAVQRALGPDGAGRRRGGRGRGGALGAEYLGHRAASSFSFTVH